MMQQITRQVAALYVEPSGCYAGLPGIDQWDEARDARKYAGPLPFRDTLLSIARKAHA